MGGTYLACGLSVSGRAGTAKMIGMLSSEFMWTQERRLPHVGDYHVSDKEVRRPSWRVSAGAGGRRFTTTTSPM